MTPHVTHLSDITVEAPPAAVLEIDRYDHWVTGADNVLVSYCATRRDVEGIAA